MLTALSIRDIVLIEKLDLEIGGGLTVLTGETGAGKSILLDALGLALGARGNPVLVRSGAERGIVTAAFTLPAGHAARRLVEEHGVEADGDLVIRRIQYAEGGSRALVNDQPVSVGLLRQIGGLLAEIHGQHDERALMDAAGHRRLLDAFGGLERAADAVAAAWSRLGEAKAWLEAERAKLERAASEREFLEHAVAELAKLAPRAGEEARLAETRQLMMNAEGLVAVVREAGEALDAGGGLENRLHAALRKLERRREAAAGHLDEVAGALERVLVEMTEAKAVLASAERNLVFDPRELEAAEERLFALRAVARKHNVTVDELPDTQARFETALDEIEGGDRRLAELEAESKNAEADYFATAEDLSVRRHQAAGRLDAAIALELAPLKLERARFATEVASDRAAAGPNGLDRVEFKVAANPGTPLAGLAKVASGGELARFMLALKVVLASRGSAPTLIFDEIDSGVGGAVADAVGQRLARLANGLQVLAVTHSPQVAARADGHFLISKADVSDAERAVTRVNALKPDSRREEIARMLSGASITEEARAQAERLIGQTG
ncbi:MAG TPA: DNA repair protein RecN [Aestuariivirgaceae bacterium]|nr:DNA repair protein RecN [Aestuariivirgaceae bacterium]